MPTQKKVDTVLELREAIERSEIAIAADYSGLSVTEMVQLRRAIRDAGVEMRVVKNRLFLIAAKEAQKPELADLLKGPTAIIFGGSEDVVAPAKATTEYMRTARNAFAVRNGVMGGQLLSLADIQSLASLPPKPVLVGQLAGALQAPIANLLGLFSNMLRNPPGILLNDSMRTFTGLLDARANQLEGAQ
jgi:large subunit ribosomal protein L10